VDRRLTAVEDIMRSIEQKMQLFDKLSDLINNQNELENELAAKERLLEEQAATIKKNQEIIDLQVK
jgi:hypothetical protein